MYDNVLLLQQQYVPHLTYNITGLAGFCSEKRNW